MTEPHPDCYLCHHTAPLSRLCSRCGPACPACHEAAPPLANPSPLHPWQQRADDVLLDDAALAERHGIPVLLACNNEQGTMDGRLRAVELHEALTLEHEGMLDDEGEAIILSAYRLTVGADDFPLIAQRSWVGNRHWCCIWMNEDTVLPFLAALQRCGTFACSEGATTLYAAWEAGVLLGAEHLALIREAAAMFRP